jgi:putative flippase GtrA
MDSGPSTPAPAPSGDPGAAPEAAPTAPAEHPPIKHIWRSEQPLTTRVVHIARHPSSLKLIKYGAVSVISTIVSQVTLFLVFGVFRLMSEVPANLLANVLATIPSYTLNRRWVWGKGGKSHWLREVVPFWCLSFAGLALSSFTVWAAGQFARDHHLSHAATAILVNAANLFAFGVLWVLKFVIYNKLFHVAPIEHPDDESPADLVQA